MEHAQMRPGYRTQSPEVVERRGGVPCLLVSRTVPAAPSGDPDYVPSLFAAALLAASAVIRRPPPEEKTCPQPLQDPHRPQYCGGVAGGDKELTGAQSIDWK